MQKLLNILTYVCDTPVFGRFKANRSLVEDLISNIINVTPQLQGKSLLKSAKKTLKAVLRSYNEQNNDIDNGALLGYRFDYKTLKDFSAFNKFSIQLENKDSKPDESAFFSALRYLHKVQLKRPSQLLKMFSELPDLIPKLNSTAGILFKDKKVEKEVSLPVEFSYLLEILLLSYNYSKNKALNQAQANTIPDNVKFDDNSNEVANAGISTVKALFDFISMLPKVFRSSIIKILVKLLYSESVEFEKERKLDIGTQIEYYGDIYSAGGLSSQITNTSLNINKAPSNSGMELESGFDEEDEEMRLAIQMSISEEDSQNNKQDVITTVKEPKGISEQLISDVPSAHNFKFFRFNVCKDIYEIAFEKIEAVQSKLEEEGLLYKIIYKILKVQHLVSLRTQVPIDNVYADKLAHMFSKHVKLFFFCFLFTYNLDVKS